MYQKAIYTQTMLTKGVWRAYLTLTLRSTGANHSGFSHMKAFAQALSAEYFVDNEYHDGPPTYGTPPTRSPGRSFSIAHGSQSPRTLRSPSSVVNGNGNGAAKRIRRISALSDFAPVNLRVRKRKKGASKGHEKKQEWMFVLVRWPLLVSRVDVCNKIFSSMICARCSYSYSFCLSSACISSSDNGSMPKNG